MSSSRNGEGILSTLDVQGNMPCKLKVILWDTLTSAEIVIDDELNLSTFRERVKSAIPDLASRFSIYYLPEGALWETNRVRVRTTAELITTIQKIFQCRINAQLLFLENDNKPTQEENIVAVNASPKSRVLGAFLFDDNSGGTRTVPSKSNRNSNRPSETEEDDINYDSISLTFVDSSGGQLDTSNGSGNRHHFPTNPSMSSRISESGLQSLSLGRVRTPDQIMTRVASNQMMSFEDRVLLRDCYACVVCSAAANIKATFMLEWDQIFNPEFMTLLGLESLNDVHNGLTLCGSCSQLFAKNQIAIDPDNFRLIVTNSVLTNEVNDRNYHWHVLNNQQIRLPLDKAQMAYWPSHAVFMHKFNLYLESLEAPGSQLAPPPSRVCCVCS